MSDIEKLPAGDEVSGGVSAKMTFSSYVGDQNIEPSVKFITFSKLFIF